VAFSVRHPSLTQLLEDISVDNMNKVGTDTVDTDTVSTDTRMGMDTHKPITAVAGSPAPAGKSESGQEAGVCDDSLFLRKLFKGELVDVSIPCHHDASLAAMWEQVDAGMGVERGSLATTSAATAGVPAVRVRVPLQVETLEMLMREQSDLSFGPRMQHMALWLVQKVEKRLPRRVAAVAVAVVLARW
jgi:hypothetical protein